MSRRRPVFRTVVRFATLTFFAGCAGHESLQPVTTGPTAYTPPPETCASLDIELPRVFTPCSKGSGTFGTWVVDDDGFPAYEYGLNEETDPRALYTNTEQAERREHWAAFGNDRLNAMFYNDGYVEVVDQDRGVEYLDKYDDTQSSYAGGFSFIDDGTETWSTAYKYRPKGASTRRRFGMGYGEAITSYRDISVTRRTFAPKGDVPMVIDDVRIENTSDAPKSIRHYEYFDVGRRSIEINWVVSGQAISTIPSDARAARDARNGMFDEAVSFDAGSKTLALSRMLASGVTAPPMDSPNPTDYYPGNPFLAMLVGDVDDTFTDQASFFANGGPSRPDAVAKRARGEGNASGMRGDVTNGLGQPRTFVLESHIDLGPHETKRLRFGYGFSPWGMPPDIDAAYRDPTRDFLLEMRSDLASKLVYFSSNDEPALHRELAWHASQIEASVGRRDYFEGRVVPQGSAYLYLHGADGAARDLGVFTMPLVYSDPPLARAELELYMRIQHAADHRFSYSFQGNGVLDDALGLHKAPSDLDIFFLWALGEYIGATGDTAIFDRVVPFWPKEAMPSATGLDHVRAAVRHLFDVVGTGEHGLIRVSDGDWSDGITLEASDYKLAAEKGESVPNTEMAIAVLPRFADILAERDAALATEIRTRVDGYRAALPTAWGGKFFGRAYFGDGKLVRGDVVDLEAQVWALIGDEAASPTDRASIVDAVRSNLDEPSPTGAELQPGGMIWPAISGLLTDGYGVSRPDLAWAHFKRHTMFAHALAYPNEWFGIWSGPDGLNGPTGDHPGEAWFSVATPMTDFPVQNNNQHAMPIYAAIREAGVVASAAGIRVEPRVPGDFTLDTNLVTVAQRAKALTVRYSPTGDASRRVDLAAPSGSVITSATMNGFAVTFRSASRETSFFIPADTARNVTLKITFEKAGAD